MDAGDTIVSARKLLAELVKGEHVEIRRVEIVGRDLAKLVESLGRPPSGPELEDFLEDHPQVSELCAATSLLEELVYRYLTPPPPEPGAVADARHPELERQLHGADTSEPYLVYADWLQEHGDPLGELIALGVAATTSESDEDIARFERHRKLHEARFLGEARHAALALRWRFGLVLELEELPADMVPVKTWEHVLALRVCELVRTLTIRRSFAADPPAARVDELFAECAPPSLRSLVLDGCGYWPARLARRELRSLAVVNRQFVLARDTLPPSLERFDLNTGELVVQTSAPLPVRELRLTLRGNTAAHLAQLGMPHVEHLALALDGAPAAKLVKLLEELELPALTRLSISDGVLDAKSFGKLAKLPFAPRLTSLALANLELTDETVQAMTRTKRAFEALTELDLSFNELSREGLEAARALAPAVVSTRQNRRGNGAEQRVRKFAGSRLVAAEGIADPKAWRRAFVDGDLRWARYRGDDDYELFVSADLERYGCTCPSSIQPCKHVVALALLAERTALPEAPSHGIEERARRVSLLAQLRATDTHDDER